MMESTLLLTLGRRGSDEVSDGRLMRLMAWLSHTLLSPKPAIGAKVERQERTRQKIYCETLSMNQSPSESARWTINVSTRCAKQWWCGRLGEEVIGNIA